MAEKVRSAPKELARRGLESGVERLRGQLRDTAQYGQRDEFGGDTLEDTAMGGFRRGTRGVERLLKGRKQGQKKEKFPAHPVRCPLYWGKAGDRIAADQDP